MPIIYVIDDDDNNNGGGDGGGPSIDNTKDHHSKNSIFVTFELYFSIIDININTNIASIFNKEGNDIKFHDVFLTQAKTSIYSSKAKKSKY